jgi:hypothetical protein
MSAPNTDPEKQKERHRAPLLGMRGVVLWALVLLVLLIVFLTVRGNDPGDGEAAATEDATVVADE